MENTFKRIINEICNENDIKCSYLSKDWVIMLEKDSKTKFISGYKFDLNLHAVGEIIDDKYALYEVLKSKNINTAEHRIVYSKNNKLDYAVGCNTYEYVKDYFRDNKNNIVLKPNSGTCGIDVYNVSDINEINNILDKLFEKNHSISISPFYDIKHEYRVIMLNGKVKLIYVKKLPIVIGDGKKTIRELLISFNEGFFIDKLQDKKYDIVLKEGESFKYNWKFNLSQGSVARRVEDNILLEKLSLIAKHASDEINLNFGSIDIIETVDGEFLILEINSGVMLENYIRLNPNDYHIAKDIYKEAVDSLFDK